MSSSRLKLLAELEQFKNLYYVNRTETDIATLAGIEAAEAIISRDRNTFSSPSWTGELEFDANPKPSNLNCRFQSMTKSNEGSD